MKAKIFADFPKHLKMFFSDFFTSTLQFHSFLFSLGTSIHLLVSRTFLVEAKPQCFTSWRQFVQVLKWGLLLLLEHFLLLNYFSVLRLLFIYLFLLLYWRYWKQSAPFLAVKPSFAGWFWPFKRRQSSSGGPRFSLRKQIIFKHMSCLCSPLHYVNIYASSSSIIQKFLTKHFSNLHVIAPDIL